MIALLEAVEFEITRDGDTLFVTVPGFRVDVFRKEDISEEVARLYGYNNIPTTFPELPAESLNELPNVAIRHKVQDLMAGFGFREAINYSFVGRDSADKLLLSEDSPLRKTVDLLNPISEDLAVMRTTLVPSMLETVSRNVAQQEKDLRLFEVGNTFSPVKGEALPVETEWLSIALSGNRTAEAWNTKATPCDFFDLKGVVEALFAALRIPEVTCDKLDDSVLTWARNGAAAEFSSNNTVLGRIYEVHPETVSRFWSQAGGLHGGKSPFRHSSRPPPRSPETASFRSSRPPAADVTLILGRAIPAAEVIARVETRKADILEAVFVKDVYEGASTPEGKKSLTLRMVYRSATQTLADKKVNKAQDKLVADLTKTFDATLPA